jgi:hypothetical protein
MKRLEFPDVDGDAVFADMWDREDGSKLWVGGISTREGDRGSATTVVLTRPMARKLGRKLIAFANSKPKRAKR